MPGVVVARLDFSTRIRVFWKKRLLLVSLHLHDGVCCGIPASSWHCSSYLLGDITMGFELKQFYNEIVILD